MPAFETNLAEHVKERYLLAPGTLRSWKHRNYIPDRYTNTKGYVTRQAASQQIVQHIKQWLQMPFIKRKGFAGLRPSVLNDLLRPNDGRKHARLRAEEASAVTQQLLQLCSALNHAANEPTLENIQALINLPFVHFKPLVGNANLYYRLLWAKEIPKTADQQLLQTRLNEVIAALPANLIIDFLDNRSK